MVVGRGAEFRLGVARVVVDDRLEPGDLIVADGRIVAIDAPRPGARGIAAPGFVDLQVNGLTDPTLGQGTEPGGVDFCRCGTDDLLAAAGLLARHGVTSFCPTLITGPPERILTALGVIARAQARQTFPDPGARIIGAHLEGPFLSPSRLGAHPSAYRLDPRPDVTTELLGRMMAAGPVRMMTVAPEVPGGAALIRELRGHGVVVAAGHSNATASEANLAFGIGVTLTTHHGNAMRPFTPRDPGLFAAALVDRRIGVPIIADGHHLEPETVRLIAAAAGRRLILVSDAVARETTLGGEKPLRLVDGAVRDADGRLAGSTLWLDEAVRNVVALGIDPGRALAAASTTPAGYLGLDDRHLRPGNTADVVILDDDLAVDRVLIGGHQIG